MKQGWAQRKLSDVAEIINGGTPDTKKKDYWGGNNLWITPAEMGKRKVPYIDKTERKITDLGLKNSSAQQLPPNSVILSSRAPIGHLVINTRPMSTNQGCKGIIPSEKIDYKFLYYFLFHNKEYLNSLGTGTTFKELSCKKLKEVQIPLPPLPEQQRIVAILDHAFAALDQAKANTEKNLQNVRELFDSELIEVFSHPGEDWQRCDLETHIKFIDYRGKTPQKTNKGIRLITAKNVKSGYLQIDPQEFIDPNIYDKWMTRGIPRKGDVLFTTEAPLANIAQLDTDEKVAFAQRIIILQPDLNVINSTYLKYMLLSEPIKRKIISNGTGATVIGIKASLLKKIGIYFPKKISDQVKIVERLDYLFLETEKLENLFKEKLVELNDLKKSILQKAFNGEL